MTQYTSHNRRRYTGAMLAWFGAMQDAYNVLSDGERRGLDHWEREHLGGGVIGTSDWPGVEAIHWAEAITAFPAAPSPRVLVAAHTEASGAMKFTDVFRNLGSYVMYYPSLNGITGSVTATIFLSNLLAWEGSQNDPEGWIYKSQKEIERETGLTCHEQDTARRLLKARNLIEENLRGVPATMHYRLNLDAIDGAWEANLIGGKRQTINSVDNTVDNASARPPANELTVVNREREEVMWRQLALLGIPDRPTYIRLVGRSPFDDPIQTVEFARRKLAEKKRQA